MSLIRTEEAAEKTFLGRHLNTQQKPRQASIKRQITAVSRNLSRHMFKNANKRKQPRKHKCSRHKSSLRGSWSPTKIWTMKRYGVHFADVWESLGKILVKDVKAKARVLSAWRRRGTTFLRRQSSSVSHIWNSRPEVCKEWFTLSSGTFPHSSTDFHTQLTRPYFPTFYPRGGQKKKNKKKKTIMYSNFPFASAGNIASLITCVESSVGEPRVTPAHFLLHANQTRSRQNGSTSRVEVRCFDHSVEPNFNYMP